MTTKKITNLVIFKTNDTEPQIALFDLKDKGRSIPYLEVDSIEDALKRFKFRLTVCTSITSEVHAYNNGITLRNAEAELHLIEHRNHYEYVTEDGTVIETCIFHANNDLEFISICGKPIIGWTSFTDLSDFVHRDDTPNHHAFLSGLINAICHTSWS